MIDIHDQMKTAPSDSSPVTVKEEASNDPPAAPRQPWPGRVWRTLKRYPIPLGAFALLVVSLVLWLAGRGDIANWTLLAVVLLGGIPLLWETFQPFPPWEVSVGVIAILASGGSLPLWGYLAGAFVVLMLPGAGALQAYALRLAAFPPWA